ncbi:MAG: hypothetical protein QE271_04450 [Bacteriovoracaceae bacterium]|nr:hypothetical protein [Bacteriovoracaceae bacterium]
MELRHVFHKTAIILTTLGMYACQNTDFYQKVQTNGYTTPGDSANEFTTGGTTSGGAPTGGSSGGSSGDGSGGSTPVPTPTPTSTGGTFNTTQTQVDRHNQAAQQKLDILFVVDNSGSMREEQQALASNFAAFANGLLSVDTDFNIAVTSTDPRSSPDVCGINYAERFDFTSAYALSNPVQFVTNFKSVVNIGINGSGLESPAKGALRFFERYPNWMREEAYLAIIVLSDEDESSQGTAEFYGNAIKSLKTNSGLVTYAPIVDINSVQAGQYGLNVGAAKHTLISNMMSSPKMFNIYDEFSSELHRLMNSLIELINSFPLSKTPSDVNTIVVKVNGIIVTSGWSYSPSSNSVEFVNNPVSGSTIEISYEYN